MNSQFKKGIIELCVIAVIAKKDMYGYEVIDTISSVLDVNENTIYPILRRLTEQDLLENYMVTTAIGAPRKYYRLTQKGIKRFEELRQEWVSFLGGVVQLIGGV